MKTTRKIKPRKSSDITYNYYGGITKNVYWATFGIWPNEINSRIINPKDIGAIDKWVLRHGFSLAGKSLNNPHKKYPTDLDTPHYDDDENKTSIFIHKKKKLMFMAAINKNGDAAVTLCFPVESWSYALAIHRTLVSLIGVNIVIGRINLMAVEHGDFCLISMSIPDPKLNLQLNYGASFPEIHEEIKAIINDKESGLILLHGITGSGKSTYIYHLLHECPKKMIFIPNSMVAAMANPDFINFLLFQAKDSVLIIEDAEKVLLKRGGAEDAGVSTLLNITDGILGKLLQCKVICTFNIERTQLDDALLRKGRLRKEHVFEKLSAVDANKLFAHLGKDRITSVPLTLADIYNDEGGRETTESQLGFAQA